MANDLYGNCRRAFACKCIDWLKDDIRPLLVSAVGYACDLDAHQFLSEIPPSARIALGPPLAGKSVHRGWCRASPCEIAQPIEREVGLVIPVLWTGDENTSLLMAHIDQMAGLPWKPTGGGLRLVWPEEGLFQI